METNNNNINELEQLREQMSIFKDKLNKQQIINDQLVRNTMKSKLSWIKSFVWGEIIIIPILLLMPAQGYRGGSTVSWL